MPRVLPPGVLALAAGVALVLGACNTPTSDLSGTIRIDGSSTVFPITEAMAEEFGLLHRGVRVTVGISGTGGGFERFCAGETDLSNASRPIKPSEVAACAERGIDFVEIPVAFDGIAVALHRDNTWVDAFTVAELQHIFRPDDAARRWSEVRPEWPDEEITVFAPGPDSGTFDYFTETIVGEEDAHRSGNTTFSEDDNVLVIGVSGEEHGIAYFGIAFLLNNQERLRAAPIVNPTTGRAVRPTPETVEGGSYRPLSRPLLLYARTDALDRPEVAAFLEFYLTEGRALVDTPEIGYVRLPDALYEAARARIRERVTGTVFAGVSAEADLAALYELDPVDATETEAGGGD